MGLKAVERKLCLACNREYTEPQISHCPRDHTQLVNLGQEVEFDRIGDTINGKYEILELLAKQVNGCTYKVRQLSDSVIQALRTIPVADYHILPIAEARLKAWSGIIDPNILRLTDFGMLDAGEIYLITELFEGKSLSTCISSRLPFQLVWCLKVFDQAASGLNEAHQNGLLHLDLNPNSIIVGGDGLVKVTDFGLSPTVKYSNDTTGLANLLQANTSYSSPEELQGKNTTSATDVYKLATVMYETCTGRLPFQGKNLIETAALIVTGKAFMPVQLGNSLSAVLSKALEKEPSNRYQSMSEFRTALAAVTV